MKTYLIGAAVAAVLGCTTANAQVLGGGLGGSLGGALSGGMRDIGVMTQGDGHAAIGTDLDTGGLRRTTSDVTGRATNRVHSTSNAALDRTQSTVGKVRSEATGVAGTAAASARRSIETTTSTAGSLASTVSANGSEASGVLNAAHDQDLLTPAAIHDVDTTAVTNVAGIGAVSNLQKNTQQGSTAVTPSSPVAGENSAIGSLPTQVSGAVNDNVAGDISSIGTSDSAANPRAPLTGQVIGSASGDVNAAKQGVAASTQSSGSANAALQR